MRWGQGGPRPTCLLCELNLLGGPSRAGWVNEDMSTLILNSLEKHKIKKVEHGGLKLLLHMKASCKYQNCHFACWPSLSFI